MAVTPVYSLPYQVLGDLPDGAALGHDLALAVEAQLARIDAVDATQNANRVTDAANIATNAANIATVLPLAAAWTDWTVAWTASVTNPTLGNGTIAGRYVTTGKTIRFWWSINIGTTTNPGSGSYFFGFPGGAACKVGAAGGTSINGGFRDNSGAVQTMAFPILVDGDTHCDMRYVNGNQVSSSSPYPWAVSDRLFGWGWIETP
jgi:hypothetical protein